MCDFFFFFERTASGSVCTVPSSTKGTVSSTDTSNSSSTTTFANVTDAFGPADTNISSTSGDPTRSPKSTAKSTGMLQAKERFHEKLFSCFSC